MFHCFACDIKKYFRYSVVAAKSQLKAEVANSYLNWLWWVLKPISFMLIYTFVFGYVFQSEEPHFPLFVFIGLIMWDFFSRMMNASVKIIRSNRAIVSRIYLPKYILILTKMWVNGFKMMISFGVVVLMLLYFQIPLHLSALCMIPILLTLAVFTFGCSCILLHYGVYVSDLSNAVEIVLRMLFYITGIFYHVEKRVPSPYGLILSRWNPMAFLITSMRNALIATEPPCMALLLVWLLFSFFLAWRGISVIYKNENSYVKVIL